VKPPTRAEGREQRIQQRQERVQQRQQQFQQRQEAKQPAAAAPSRAAERAQQRQQSVQQRLQQLQQTPSRRLSRSERRELRQLRREDITLKREVQRQQRLQQQQTSAPTAPQQAGAQASSERLQQLQQQARQGRLSRADRRELRQLQRAQRIEQQQQQQQQRAQTDQQRFQQLQQQAQQGRLTRAERRELRRLRRTQPQAPQLAGEQRQQRRALRARQVAPEQAAQGRFAAPFRANASATDRDARRARRAARLAARAAWRLGLLASYVPWRGAVYWPYAYNDIFYYTFWPDAYDPGYWYYAYDDFFDGIFFPYGAPYVEYAYEGPYEGPYASVTTGSAPSRSSVVPGRLSQSARDFCKGQATGITAWPFDRIERAVQPTSEQKKLLDDLKQASHQAADRFEEACPDIVPMTPPGRLQAMTMRLQATLDAVKTVRPAMAAFYESLSDEQKARFNDIGPELPKPRQGTAGNGGQSAQADCSGEKAGLANLPIERIEQAVEPNDAQYAALERLEDAMQKAVDSLRGACPNTTPLTPVGRLEVVQKRLEAMIEAANAVRPALDDFYAALNNEQKAKFNRLGPQTAQTGN
jgi:hypothetical protein